jgi:hypothetical protein
VPALRIFVVSKESYAAQGLRQQRVQVAVLEQATEEEVRIALIIAMSLMVAACGGGHSVVPVQPASHSPQPVTQTVQIPQPVALSSMPVRIGSEPVLKPDQPWEGNNVEDGSTVKVGSIFYHFYCAGDSHLDIGFATASEDAFPVAWTKSADNPIILASAFYSGAGIAACAPRVVQMKDGGFRMYVHSFDGVHDRGFLLTTSAAEFPKGWVFANNGNAIFSEGYPGEWDSQRIQTQTIIPSWEAPDGLWHLFYNGTNGSNGFSGGHATSLTGITGWKRDVNNPVMVQNGTGWRAYGVSPLGWFKIGNTFYILTQGAGADAWSLGYYSTTDLFNLHPSTSAILSKSQTWDSTGIEGVDAIQDGESIWLFYLGTDIRDAFIATPKYRVGVARIN